MLLVGGSSRMPAAVDMLRQLSGKEPDASGIARRGSVPRAALQAGLLLAKGDGLSKSWLPFGCDRTTRN